MIASLVTIGLLFLLDCFLGGLILMESRKQRAYWARLSEREEPTILVEKTEFKELSAEAEEHYRTHGVTEQSARYKEWVRQQREHGH